MKDLFLTEPPKMPVFALLKEQATSKHLDSPTFAFLPMITQGPIKEPIVDFIAQKYKKTMSSREIKGLFADILAMDVPGTDLLPFFGSTDYGCELTKPSFRRQLNPVAGPIIHIQNR